MRAAPYIDEVKKILYSSGHPMPNKHAAVKDLRKNKRRAERNALLKTHVKALTKQMNELIKEEKKTEAMELSRKLQQIVAKASKNHIFHPNKAARKTSALQTRLNKMK